MAGAEGTAIANVNLYNNTIIANGRSGIVLYGVVNGFDIANNILDRNGTVRDDPNRTTAYGITTDIPTLSGARLIRYNLFHANWTGDWSGDLDTIAASGSNIPNAASNSDPKFFNDESSDWHILSSSGAIENGVNLYSSSSATDYDYDSYPRASDPGVNYDIGAYVYRVLP